ncbi:hypothetical protein [Spirosoma foliorum]|uniref:ZU5 domain-containing protein n=1 Tax=Spirosoma foliorum TaxID=2710596 RepID=A0A7G5H1L2_9BACT|nr:hypothetical protein [Spirosoma foliorum]QMW05004.1 hypothetical protein H3H32_08975 [Spirosoma foliorum]
MNRFLYVPLFFLVGLLACQKSTDAVNPVDTTKPADTTTHTPSPHTGVVYEHGAPVGQPIQKTIGPEGGTLASADGTLSMTIPAGAVSKATTFTMQPVTPTLPGLINGQSFRLLPEGQTFDKPIKLQYKYNVDSLDGTSAQALFMAYQGSDGYWKALLNTELDETTQTLTVSTKHFSDWGAFAEYTLEAKPDYLSPGQSSTLQLYSYSGDLVSSLTSSDLEVHLSRQKTLEDPSNIRNWRVVGKGKLDVAASNVQATYSSPAGSAQGADLVTVDVYNFLPPDQQPRKGATGKAVLMKTIRYGGTYFRVTIDGKPINSKGNYGFTSPSIQTFGTMLDGGQTLSLLIHKPSLAPGVTPYASIETEGRAEVALGEGNRNLTSNHAYCDSDGWISYSEASPWNAFIDEVKVINGVTFVTGTFKAEVYWVEGNCPNLKIDKRMVSAEFKVAMAN